RVPVAEGRARRRGRVARPERHHGRDDEDRPVARADPGAGGGRERRLRPRLGGRAAPVGEIEELRLGAGGPPSEGYLPKAAPLFFTCSGRSRRSARTSSAATT